MDEMDKLLVVNFIREVYYPEWLSNIVMVKKANENGECTSTSQI